MKHVTLNEGLEALYVRATVSGVFYGVFKDTEIEEIVLPKSLKIVDGYTFNDCEVLRKIHVEDGCEADLYQLRISDPIRIGPLPEIAVGGVSVWSLRELHKIVIPEGVARIGSSWFYGSEIESVEISASVRELGQYAFCGCEKLKRVSFQQGSVLEKIETGCFEGSTIEEITIPKNVTEI